MGKIRTLWRKLAAQFSDTDRKGWEELARAGYVEEPEYKQAAEAKAGYFCSTCAYIKKQDGAKYGVVCTKLNNAEDAEFGCCNYWEKRNGQEESKVS